METPEKVYADGGLKSHRVMGLQDELTPTPGSTPNSKFRGNGTPSPDKGQPEAAAGGQSGGVTGFIKSMISGTPVDEPARSETVTAQGDLKDGTTGLVKSTSGTGSAPTSLTEGSSQPVGAATTQLKETSSPYTSALEPIAGPAETTDLSEKYGSALEPIADAPAYSAAGVVGAVSAAAGSAVETLKQAAGYGTSQEETQAADASTGDVLASGPAVVTPSDLPKFGEVHSNQDGTVEIVDGSSAKDAPNSAAASSFPAAGAATAASAAPKATPETVTAQKEAPSSGPQTPQVNPQPVQEGVKPIATTTATPTSGTTGAAGIAGKPPVSAFASQSNTGLSQPGEIKEEGAAPVTATQTAAKPAEAPTAAGTSTKKTGTEGEKAKAPVCGCCTIS